MRSDAVSDDVMTAIEAAAFLRIGRNAIYDLVGRNEIPHRRLGKQIRFSRAALVQWLSSCGRSRDALKGH